MILSINKFDYSYKKQIANPKKVYAIDTGFSNSVSFNISQKREANLENIVFLELRRRAKKIYYYKTQNGLEVDFLVREENITKLIQVSLNSENKETYKRELRVFAQAKKELRGDIQSIRSKVIEYDGEEIKVINILKFLLEI